MPKLPPSGYVPADETNKPGYLARRMKVYRQLIEDAKRRRQQNEAEVQEKVKPLIKVKS